MTHWNPLPFIAKGFDSFIDFLREKNTFAILMLISLGVMVAEGYIIYVQDQRLAEKNATIASFDKVLVSINEKHTQEKDSITNKFQVRLDDAAAQRIREQALTIKALQTADSIRRADAQKYAAVDKISRGIANRATSIKRKTDSLEKILNKRKE